MRKRLAVYQNQTRPLVDYYARWAAGGDAGAPRCCRISGSSDRLTDIAARVRQALAG